MEEKVSSINKVNLNSNVDKAFDQNITSLKTDASELYQTPLSPSYSLNVRTITLPETHIFTPEKGTNSISQSVDRNQQINVTANFTLVKEYHDVEYNLEKTLNSTASKESVPSLSQAEISNVITTVSNSDTEQISSIILKPESGKPNAYTMNYIKKDNFPIFGTSPTDTTTGPKEYTKKSQQNNEFDDDFTEFQAAPTPFMQSSIVSSLPVEPLKPKPVQTYSACNPLPLSPVHLMNNAAANTLPEPDDDEMIRIEAFARSKIQTSEFKADTKTINNNDDDEWTDFTSATSIPTNVQNTSSIETSFDDDWSDFVFTTPASSKPMVISQKVQQYPTSWGKDYTQQKPNWNTSEQHNTNQVSYRQNLSKQHQNRMPELNFVAPKPIMNVPRHQSMRK